MTVKRSSGFDFVLGPLESEVMEILWALGGWVTVAEVLEERELRGGSSAYSTVKAVLQNLHDKGHLKKRPDGKQNVFTPVFTRGQFARRAVGRVVDPLLRHHRNPLLAHIVDELIDDDDAIAELSRLLAAKRGKRSK
jgi:predicted transcriptional regulator